LRRLHLLIAMNGRGRRMDDAVTERPWCSLKEENIYLKAR
jgi:hypothetical protein